MNQINHSSDKRDIELKSPPVQEILGRPPRWVIRWGITVIMVVIAGVFVGSYFFKYPDVVSAAVEVTTENLPVTLVARATGKLDTLFVADNEIVEKDRYLAVIENPADFGDVLALKMMLAGFNDFFSTDPLWFPRGGKKQGTRSYTEFRHCEGGSPKQSSENQRSGLLRSARNDARLTTPYSLPTSYGLAVLRSRPGRIPALLLPIRQILRGL